MNGKKREFGQTAHSTNKFSAKISVTNKPTFSGFSWSWEVMEITKVKNSLSKTITVYNIDYNDGTILNQIDVQPGKEEKPEYCFPVIIAIPGDAGEEKQQFRYDKVKRGARSTPC
jgi:hypothetical protein